MSIVRDEKVAKELILRAAQEIEYDRKAAADKIKYDRKVALRAEIEAAKVIAKGPAGPEALAAAEYERSEKAVNKIAAEQISLDQQIARAEWSLSNLKQDDVKLKRKREAVIQRFNIAEMNWGIHKKVKESEPPFIV